MRILTTGGAGFIGHNVVKILEKAGHHVDVIDSCTTYGSLLDKDLVSQLVDERTASFNQAIYNIDIRDFNRVNHIIKRAKPNVIIHLASSPRAKVVDNDPVTGCEVMGSALMNLLVTAKDAGVRRFVYISSSMVYGDFNARVYEHDTCTPIGLYGILKLTGEHIVRDWCRKHGIEFVIIRPSAVYGPRDVSDRVLGKFLSAAINNQPLVVCGPDERLDFSYVEDVATGIVKAATVPKAANGTYNITRGVGVTLLAAAKLCIEVAGGGTINTTNRNDSFPRRGALDITKAKEDLKYNPEINLERGIEHYYNWIKDKGPLFRA